MTVSFDGPISSAGWNWRGAVLKKIQVEQARDIIRSVSRRT